MRRFCVLTPPNAISLVPRLLCNCRSTWLRSDAEATLSYLLARRGSAVTYLWIIILMRNPNFAAKFWTPLTQNPGSAPVTSTTLDIKAQCRMIFMFNYNQMDRFLRQITIFRSCCLTVRTLQPTLDASISLYLQSVSFQSWLYIVFIENTLSSYIKW